MGGQIRRGWIWRFWGAPIFRPEAAKPFKNRYLGPLDWKSGRPKNAKSYHDGSDPPFAALWLALLKWGCANSVVGLELADVTARDVTGFCAFSPPGNWPLFTQISGRNFLPEIFGEVHPETAPLQARACALCSTEQSTFRGGEKGEKVPRKGEEKGWPAKGQKGKKDARKQVRKSSNFLYIWGDFLATWHSKPGEKGQKIHQRKFKKSSRDGAPRLQISVPCRGRTCPECVFFKIISVQGVPRSFRLSSTFCVFLCRLRFWHPPCFAFLELRRAFMSSPTAARSVSLNVATSNKGPDNEFECLAAQCEIPPHIAQYPFEIVSQRGVSQLFALFSKDIAQVSLRYLFCGGGGGIAPPLRMPFKEKTLRKRGRGYRTQLLVETPKTP